MTQFRFLTPSIRLSLLYGGLFGTLGVYSSFWPVWLSHQGLEAQVIAQVFSVALCAKVLFSPFFLSWLDRSGKMSAAVPWLCWTAFIGFVIYANLSDMRWVYVLAIVTTIALLPLVPVLDSISALQKHNTEFRYARVRLWGSVTFMVMTVTTGSIVDLQGPQYIATLVCICLFFLSVFGHFTPKTPVSPTQTKTFQQIWSVLRHPKFFGVLCACTCIQSSHAVYYVFSTLHWTALGYSTTSVGFLWAWGVLAEILFFWWMGGKSKTLSARLLICIAGSAAALRWTGTAFDPSISLLFVLQTLHAVTFGLTHLGLQMFITRHLPEHQTGTAQALASSVALGLGSAAMMAAAGAIYEDWQGLTFLLASVTAAVGSIIVAVSLGLSRRKPGE